MNEKRTTYKNDEQRIVVCEMLLLNDALFYLAEIFNIKNPPCSIAEFYNKVRLNYVNGRKHRCVKYNNNTAYYWQLASILAITLCCSL